MKRPDGRSPSRLVSSARHWPGTHVAHRSESGICTGVIGHDPSTVHRRSGSEAEDGSDAVVDVVDQDLRQAAGVFAESDRSISSSPSGTATESFGSPLAFAGSRTLPALAARATFDVTGTTWLCQTFTLSTSTEDTTTHGRRLSRSIQYTPPLITTERNAPSVPPSPATERSADVGGGEVDPPGRSRRCCCVIRGIRE